MSLLPGTRVGHYEIRSALGAGGMGQVYVARDTQLNRDVALKVLPDSFASDPERVARFTREAQTLASLNHPHIAQIHGFEQSGELRALAMELVEGEDLSQRIARGALPIEEALPIARQIAEALEAAHGQGIIHRDLKPANVKVRPDGTVKVLDFGLAKAIEGITGAGRAGGAGGAGTVEYSPTITSPAMMTGVGVVLGTAAYMAPEQAKGRAVDRRCDIWAFGCVLFEMLTARRAFPGDDLTDVLAAVVRGEPEWGALPPETPAPIRTLLKRCVEKDPARRIADPSTLRFVIDEAATLAAPAAAVPQAAQPERGRVWRLAPTAIAVLVAIALAFPAVRHLRETPPAAAPELRLDIVTPPSSDPESFALSPDGRSLVFVASDGGRPKLWLRALDRTTTKMIPGTEDAIAPFWSPDGRSIGFFAAGKLLRLDLDGAAPRAIADAPSPLGGTWTVNGSILFTPATVSPVMRVPAGGGPAEPLTQMTSGQTSHVVPIALPDGRHFVFSVVGTPAMQGIYLGSVEKSAPKKLLALAMAGAFLPPDRIVYFLADRIVTQRMDLATESLVGEPATIASSSIGSVNLGGLALSASANGILAYRNGVGTHRALTWRDRSGQMIGRLGNAVEQFPALSPDGRAVAGTRADFDIWLTDVARNSETRFTFDPAIDALPIWSPDSRRLAFASNRAGTFAIYVGPVSQPGSEERLFVSQYPTIAQDWSSDGRWLLYYENRPGVGRDLWALDMISPDRKRRPVAVTPAEETLAKFSPDGRWVAYQTNASGRFEIVVKAFGDGAAQGGMWQVSRSGGVAPVWSRDGKELYFFAPDGSMQASPITARTDTIEAGSPVRLFTARVGGAGGIDAGTVYCVSRDGRFLISEVVDADAPPITIVVNPKF